MTVPCIRSFCWVLLGLLGTCWEASTQHLKYKRNNDLWRQISLVGFVGWVRRKGGSRWYKRVVFKDDKNDFR
jgi:hypothetical protein